MKLLASMAGLLALPLLAHPQGTIVYHNPPDIRIFSDGATLVSTELDLDGDGTTDFTFAARTRFWIQPASSNEIVCRPVGGFDLGSYVWPMLGNDSISPALNNPALLWTGPEIYVSPTGEISMLYPYFHDRSTSGTSGPWQSGVNAYIGVRFTISDQLHYGWIKLLIPNTTPDNRRNGGIIEEWAYNSIPGQSILAGQVPEPGTVALIVAGAALLYWRPRRRLRPD